MKNFLTKFLPAIVAVANVVASAFVPQVASFWGQHSTVAAILSVLALFMPQPHK